MLINFSNHPYNTWGDKQKDAGAKFGTVVDLPFPAVSSKADEREIKCLAEKSLEIIIGLLNDEPASAVMVQGEFTLTYAVVSLLLKRGIKAISACSERRVTEVAGEDGKLVRHVEFSFERFREYR